MNGNQNTPFLVPYYPPQPQQQQSREEVPARVRAALVYLDAATNKTMTRVAVNDMAIEEIDGQKLTIEESKAQCAACSLLTDYFQGKFKMDTYEKTLRNTVPTDRPCTILQCIACSPGPTKPDCPLCNGSGQMLTFPGG